MLMKKPLVPLLPWCGVAGEGMRGRNTRALPAMDTGKWNGGISDRNWGLLAENAA